MARRWRAPRPQVRILADALAETTDLRRDDDEPAPRNLQTKIFLISIGRISLGAVRPKPDEVFGAISVAMQRKYARQLAGDVLRDNKVHRHFRRGRRADDH